MLCDRREKLFFVPQHSFNNLSASKLIHWTLRIYCSTCTHSHVILWTNILAVTITQVISRDHDLTNNLGFHLSCYHFLLSTITLFFPTFALKFHCWPPSNWNKYPSLKTAHSLNDGTSLFFPHSLFCIISRTRLLNTVAVQPTEKPFSLIVVNHLNYSLLRLIITLPLPLRQWWHWAVMETSSILPSAHRSLKPPTLAVTLAHALLRSDISCYSKLFLYSINLQYLPQGFSVIRLL